MGGQHAAEEAASHEHTLSVQPALYHTSPEPQHHAALTERRLEELQDEMAKLRMEREHVAAVRANMDQAARALDQERTSFETEKVHAHWTLLRCAWCHLIMC
jgi:hypothetical protein